MSKAKCPGPRSRCPINMALEIFGDRWSLLIVRDLMFSGRKTFHDFLTSGENIASNILSDRLKMLEAQGILERQRDAKDARRINYALTEKGIDLAPVLVEMIVWATQHEQTAAPQDVVAAIRGNRKRYLGDIRNRWSREIGR